MTHPPRVKDIVVWTLACSVGMGFLPAPENLGIAGVWSKLKGFRSLCIDVGKSLRRRLFVSERKGNGRMKGTLDKQEGGLVEKLKDQSKFSFHLALFLCLRLS